MARDFDPYDLSVMTDDEIYDLVMQHLGEYPELDVGWIEVAVQNGRVTLEGSVGSDGEAQIVEKALVEVLGVNDLVNNLVVNETRRGEAPDAADDAAAREDEVADQLGDGGAGQHSDTASHLVEDLEAETYGTQDVGAAVQDGASYTPPQRPVPDGYTSREDH